MLERKTVFIGRADDNQKKYNKADISGKHAKITALGNNEYEVEDLGSTNGTYVNGYRIKKAIISDKDQLRLSIDTIIDVPSLFGIKNFFPPQKPKNTSKDFTEEFAALKPLYDDYKSERIKLTVDYNKRLGLIRSAISMAPMVGIIFLATSIGEGGEQEVRNHLGMGMMLVMTLGSSLANYLTSDNSKQQARLEEFDENFRIRYVCPNPECQHQLNGTSWNVLHNMGECPKCRAIYNKNKLKNIL